MSDKCERLRRELTRFMPAAVIRFCLAVTKPRMPLKYCHAKGQKLVILPTKDKDITFQCGQKVMPGE
jgi:hypothetical protein